MQSVAPAYYQSETLAKPVYSEKIGHTKKGVNYSYFGARYYDSDLSVFISIDPASDQRSWISPYNYCQWNPVGRVDPTGALDGDYLGTDGRYLGSDGIDDGKVYVVKTDETSLTKDQCLNLKNDYERASSAEPSDNPLKNALNEKTLDEVKLLNINSKSLIYRATWMYGEGATTKIKEGGGEDLTKYYAWVMKNAASYFRSDEVMMRAKMNTGGPSLYPSFENGELDGAYSGIIPKQETVQSLSGKIPKGVFQSIINADQGWSSDPTNGSYGWFTQSGTPNLNGTSNKVSVLDVNGVWHVFGNR